VRRPAAATLVLLALVTTGCAHLWSARPQLDAQSHKETAALLQRVRLYDHPALADYLAGLSGRAGVTVRIVRDPTLALFSTPAGDIIVHTGLLAVARSEAQLAAVLGHEAQHVARDEAFAAGEPDPLGQTLRPPTTSLTAVAIFGQNLPLLARAAVTGYGARRERGADAAALAGLERAGREPGEAAAMYEALGAQAARGGAREMFYFGNPARLAERLAAVRELQGRRGVAAGPLAEDFEARMRDVLLENAHEEIQQARFDLARLQLARVAVTAPDSARLHLYDGELHRLEAQRAGSVAEREVELVQARAAYERALLLDPTLGEVHRQLGLLYYASRDLERARGELERYLAVAPSAPDRARVSEYLQELAR